MKQSAFVRTTPMSSTSHLRRLRLPRDVVLTSVVISGIICKLSTADLTAVLEAGHNELDRRYSDPDMEPNGDFEPEPE